MTKEEAIKAFKKNREECMPFGFSGDNKAALSVMIKVLEEDMDDEDIEVWADDDNLYSAAISALEFKDGGYEDIEDFLYPVKD